MKLKDLLENIEYELIQGNIETDICDIVTDSRKIKPACVFVCIGGASFDGHDFAAEAARLGAGAIICERKVDVPEGTTLIQVENTRKALALMSCAYFSYPAEKLITIGITGTKGKTTTTYMIRNALELAGIKTGLIGTIETLYADVSIPSNNTTPEPYLVQKYFNDMVLAGCKCVVMEVSSQGLKQDRVAGINFDYGIFTNLEPDHIGKNEHKDFEEYTYCKSLLFKQCKIGIFNADDAHVESILKGHTCKVETFGINKEADFTAYDIKHEFEGGKMSVEYKIKGKLNTELKVNIPGTFTVYNSLTAAALLSHFDLKEDVIKKALKDVKVKGRLESVSVSDKYTLMIDYAHNAMSLKSLLITLREYDPGRLICLFGCGGNRSKERRYEMGEISSEYADLTVVTSDNPRFEEPLDIINDILTGVKKKDGKYVTIPDRKQAIKFCLENARPRDIIVLAGKGHEDYQEIKGVKYPMDERILIKEVLEEINGN
ncbi:MAG: UDP-N-acetylmuramoyl-L-alanyl-D-glutamate--2,6-diaminopimelate ligase [Lachnospiraceae bacterium]|nr:UDP-N-acetylmuramoyl-L-alanyl-D-glutamate--2,6-diaminopimelate ligase [Lachnospiraceae bacterium]